MQNKFTRQELLTMVENVLKPELRSVTEDEASRQLFVFCASCPDPAAAMWLMVESMEPLTPPEIVDRALAYPYRDMKNVPETELYIKHPLRYIRYGIVDEK